MQTWSRPDPLTRDLIHLINARRHDHGDTDAAIDTLQAFLEQGREHRITSYNVCYTKLLRCQGS